MVQRDEVPEEVTDIEKYIQEKFTFRDALDSAGGINTEIDDVGNDAYRYAPRGDVSLYGEQKVGSKVPQIEIQWWEEEDPEVTLDSIIEGSASATTKVDEGYASINTGTDTSAKYDGQTFEEVDYLTSAEIKVSFSLAWIQPPTSDGDYSTIGLSNGTNGFEVGYKGDTFGIRRLRDGSEKDFVPKSDFNGDKLDGSTSSEYERQNEPVEINHQTYDMWRIRYGWYGVAPTHIEVLAPDGHWVFVHKFDFTNEKLPQTDKPDLPIRTLVEKNGSDSTNIEQRISAFFGGIIANVELSQQPDGDYVSKKATGQSLIEENLLTANEEFVSDWYDTDGWGALGLSIFSDQPSAENGVVVEYTDDVQQTNPSVESTKTFTFTRKDITGSENLYVVLPTQLDGYRIRYKNGNTGQTEFTLVSTLFEEIRPRQTNLNTPVPEDAVVSTNRSIIFAEAENDDVEKIYKASPGRDGGLRTAISEHETDTPIRPDNTFETNQADIPDADGGGPIEVLNGGGLAGRTEVRISNDGTAPVFLGEDNTLTTDTGYQINSGDEKSFPLDESVRLWMIAQSGTGSSSTSRLDATAAGTSGTATNPDNAISSDGSRAVYDADGELINASGYDASNAKTQDEVSDVMIGFEGRQKDTSLNKSVEFQEVATGTGTGGTSVTTDTALSSVSGNLYIASVSNRDSSAQVDSVVGLGLDWTELQTVQNGAEIRTTVYVSSGTPTTSGTVTANFDQTINSGVISVTRWSNVVGVESSGTNTNSTTGWSATTPSTTSNGRTIGISGIGGRETTNDPGTDDTEHSDTTVAGGGNTRMAHTVQSRNAAGGSSTSDGTWAKADEWAAIAVALEPETLDDASYLLEYEVGSEGTGATYKSGVVSSTTDTDNEVNVTGDRAWTYTDIDNTTVTLTYNDGGREELEADHIYVEFTEVDTSATQRVSFYEGGKQ
jgi:hypothetical protein